FLVTDVDTPIRDLSVRALSGDETLIANTNMLFFGETNFVASLPSSEVELTLRPNQGQTGSTTITVIVDDTTTDDPAQTVTAPPFAFIVNEFNDPPTISAIPDISIPAGQSSTNIVFTVGDQEGQNVTVTATSSDQSLVANSDIVITGGAA